MVGTIEVLDSFSLLIAQVCLPGVFRPTHRSCVGYVGNRHRRGSHFPLILELSPCCIHVYQTPQLDYKEEASKNKLPEAMN